ncbi:unnamed protein product [Effrenium voratum]|nr:unnamed protein product [Effrenium voratum]
MYRQLEKHGAAKDTYKWLTDEIKLRFRQTWAMQRSFDFVKKSRVRSISIVTSNKELGMWRNQLQLEQHFGGVGLPEAVRQADNYIRNCKKWPETFTRYNAWTEADNYLLVESLVSQTSEEAWREVAESSDSSATYELEAYRTKARRKYAVVHGLALEAVNLETVEKSTHGIKGWAEMNVVVPNINDGARDAVPKAKAKGKARAKANVKGSGPDVKELEKEARESLMKSEPDGERLRLWFGHPLRVRGRSLSWRSTRPWRRASRRPCSPRTAKTSLLLSTSSSLRPSPRPPSRTSKKTWGDKYHNMLTLFNDRCSRICGQTRACTCFPFCFRLKGIKTLPSSSAVQSVMKCFRFRLTCDWKTLKAVVCF